MKKSQGPSLIREIIPLKACSACKGAAVIKGLFHQLDCLDCNASGWVRFDNGEALELQELVTQLGFNLRVACKQIDEHMSGRRFDAPEYYEQNNRRGAGASNFTGD